VATLQAQAKAMPARTRDLTVPAEPAIAAASRASVTDNMIVLQFIDINHNEVFRLGLFNGYDLRTAPGTPSISAVTIDSSVTNMPMDSSRVHVSTDAIQMDLQGLAYSGRSALKPIVAFST
jgi:hypothetical protein